VSEQLPAPLQVVCRVAGVSRSAAWAVIDSGIDARHPAFARRGGGGPVDTTGVDPLQSEGSRVAGTWDFATIRQVLPVCRCRRRALRRSSAPKAGELSFEDPGADEIDRLSGQVARGRSVDWGVIAPLLAVPHDADYREPADDHGMHVAGILAGDWRSDDQPSAGPNTTQGICPDLWIYDLRAFDAAGASD
jgi:serine protease AprX